MIKISFTSLIYGIFFSSLFSHLIASSYNSSPLNYNNSSLNYENSSLNYNNSPLNYENSQLNPNNNRIIRNENGEGMGYVVPKDDGGANIFDFNGNRLGYVPANE